MFYTLKDFKSVIKVTPKSACTSAKSYIHQLLSLNDSTLENLIEGVHPHSPEIFSYLHSNTDVFNESSENLRLIVEENFTFILLYRNPYDRLYSGLNQKFIQFFPNSNSNLLDPNCPSPRIKNFYLWFDKFISKNTSDITSKHLIDFHCLNVSHDYEIDPHFLPIYNLVPKDFLPFVNLIEVDTLFTQKLNSIFKVNFKEIRFNVMNNTDPVEPFNEQLFLQHCYSDTRVKQLSSYFRKSVSKMYKEDFNLYSNVKII